MTLKEYNEYVKRVREENEESRRLARSKREKIYQCRRILPYVISNKVGRNKPCSCGSGKKYKVCCGK